VFGQGSSVPPLEGFRLKTHDQPQQPGTELLGTAGLRGIDGLLVDRNEWLWLDDPSCYSIDHSYLIGVKITTAKRIPDRGQIGCQPPRSSEQAAEGVRLLTEHQ